MAEVFETAIQKIGRILARQYNIDIVFEGEQAMTDGKKIVLPFFNNLTPELKADINGYLDHEVAHCKFTEFEVIPKVINRFHKEILNAVEDIRIERLMIEEYPGTAGHLNPLKAKWREKSVEKLKTMPWPIRLMLATQYEMDGYPATIDAEIRPYWNAIKAEREKLNGCTSTTELFEITKEITKKVMKESDKQDEKGKGEEKKGEGEEKKGEGEKGKGEEKKGEEKKGEGEGEGEGKEEKGKGEGSHAIDAKIINEKDGEEKSKWDEHCTSAHKLINSEIKDFIKSNPEEKPAHMRARRDYTMSSSRHTPISTRFDRVVSHVGKGDPKKYRELKLKVHKTIAPIRRTLERILKVKENAKFKMDQERGRVDTKNLSRLMTSPGFRTPFKNFTKVDTKNVAIELLVDMSGSMMGKMDITKQTVVAIAESLKDLDIKFEVTGFYAVYDREMQDLNSSMDKSRIYNRTAERLEHHVFKGFDDHSLNGIEKIQPYNNNVDGESVRWAASRLAQRKQERKILMVFSDGMPNAESDVHILNGDLKRAISEIKKSGIECIGFGIKTEAVKHFYPEYLIVNELKDLPGKVMNKLTQIITRGLR